MNVNLPLWSRLPTAYIIIHHRIRLPSVMVMRFLADLGEAEKPKQTPGLHGLKNNDGSGFFYPMNCEYASLKSSCVEGSKLGSSNLKLQWQINRSKSD